MEEEKEMVEKELEQNLEEPRGVSGPCNVLGQTKRPLVYNPDAGTHIDHACKHAAALSINSGRDVHFKFNDVALVATPETSWKQLSERFDAECKRRSEEYHNSPEGKAADAKRRREIIAKQQAVDALIRYLPNGLAQGLDEAVRWVKEFTTTADDVAVKFDKSEVVLTFRDYGYRTNEHVGEKPEWFNTRERIGRYLIGQVMNCLESGMPPHPRAISFCDQYFKARKTRKDSSVPSPSANQPVPPGNTK